MSRIIQVIASASGAEGRWSGGMADLLETRGVELRLLDLGSPEVVGPDAAVPSGYDHGLSFDANCGRLLEPVGSVLGRLAGQDILIIEADEPLVIGCAARCIADLTTPPHVTMLFRRGARDCMSRASLRGSLLTHALRELVGALGRLPRMLASHESLADALMDLTGGPCGIVMDPDDGGAGAASTLRTSLTHVALIADADDPQSAFALPEIARETLRTCQHGLILDASDVRRSYPLRELADWDRIHVAERSIGVDPLVPAAALLVLPRERYHARTSSRFSLLAGLGVPMVVPSGTTMAEAIDRGQAVGMSYPRDATASVMQTAGAMMNDLAPWCRAADVLAPIWRSRSSLARFVDVLLDQVPRPDL